MYLLHNIGPRVNSNYNTAEEIMRSNGPISFDGVYENVFKNHKVLEGRNVFFFIMGNTIGLNNSFDKGMPLETFCDQDQIMWMVKKYDVNLGWHTWSHRDLTLLTDGQIITELTPPDWIPIKYFAYPYGNVNEKVASLVEKMGYEAAWSVSQGDNSLFQINRKYLNW